MNTVERNSLKKELALLGIRGEYLEGWQVKEDLWGHKPKLNIDGVEVKPAGYGVPNQPADMDHKYRLAIRGVLPWRPSESCGCKACRERDWSKFIINDEGHIIMAQENTGSSFEDFVDSRLKCDDCEYVVKAESRDPKASLRLHRRGKHKELVAA